MMGHKSSLPNYNSVPRITSSCSNERQLRPSLGNTSGYSTHHWPISSQNITFPLTRKRTTRTPDRLPSRITPFSKQLNNPTLHPHLQQHDIQSLNCWNIQEKQTLLPHLFHSQPANGKQNKHRQCFHTHVAY